MVEDSTDQAGTHRTTSDTKRGRLSWLGWTFLVGLPLYLLSTGPVSCLEDYGYLPEEVYQIYFPLEPLMKVEWIGRIFDYWSMDIWHSDTHWYIPPEPRGTTPPPPSTTNTRTN